MGWVFPLIFLSIIVSLFLGFLLGWSTNYRKREEENNQECHRRYRIGFQNGIEAFHQDKAELVINAADSVDGFETGKCPACGKALVNKLSNPTRFCKYCGKAVKWD